MAVLLSVQSFDDEGLLPTEDEEDDDPAQQQVSRQGRAVRPTCASSLSRVVWCVCGQEVDVFPLHLCRFLDEDAALLPLLALPCLHTTDQVRQAPATSTQGKPLVSHTQLPPSFHLCLAFFSPSSYPLCL